MHQKPTATPLRATEVAVSLLILLVHAKLSRLTRRFSITFDALILLTAVQVEAEVQGSRQDASCVVIGRGGEAGKRTFITIYKVGAELLGCLVAEKHSVSLLTAIELRRRTLNHQS